MAAIGLGSCQNPTSKNTIFELLHSSSNNTFNFHYYCIFGHVVNDTHLSSELVCVERTGLAPQWKHLNGENIDKPSCVFDTRIVVGTSVGGPLLILLLVMLALYRRSQRNLRHISRGEINHAVSTVMELKDDEPARAPTSPGIRRPSCLPTPPVLIVDDDTYDLPKEEGEESSTGSLPESEPEAEPEMPPDDREDDESSSSSSDDSGPDPLPSIDQVDR